MKKRKIFILLSIVILIIAGFVTRKKIKEYNCKWGDINQTFMADFTGNGKKELLIIYDIYEDKSAMKLVDVENGKTIWKSSTHPSHIHEIQRITLQDTVLAVAYYDFVNEPDSGNCELGVEGFSSITGEKLWDYHFSDNRRDFGLYFWLVGYKGKVFTNTDDNNLSGYITCIDIKTGNALWEDTLNYYASWSPHFIDNRMILGAPRELSVVDIETGEITKNINFGRFSRLITTDSNIFFHAKDTVFVYDSVTHPFMFNDEPVTFTNSDSGSAQLAAHSDGNFIYIKSHFHDSILNHEIKSSPYKEGKKKFSYCFGDSMIIQHWFSNEALARNPEVSPFYDIETKHIPLIVRKEINEDSSWKQLAIFDVEQGKPKWISKAYKFKDTDFILRDILYHKGFFIIGFDFTSMFDHKADHAFLVIDGNSGLFKKCINVYSEDVSFSISNWDNYQMFSGDYFYGSHYDIAWVLNFPNLEIVYSTNKKLKTRDCKKRLEEMFGKMPWERIQNNE